MLTFLVSCVPGGPDSQLRYGGQYYAGEFLLYGHPEFWEQRQLEVNHILFSSGAENNEALIAGTVDVNCGADTRTVALFNAIPDEALIIGTVERGDRYVTVVRVDSTYRSWDELRGKTVATRFGTGAEGILRKYYDQEGLRWEDFKYVNLNVEDMIASLEIGQIEAFTAWEPTPAIAEANGIGRPLRAYGDIGSVPACIHTTRSFAYGHEEVLVRFLAAHLDKAELIRSNPSQAAAMAVEAAARTGLTVPAGAFETVFRRVDFSVDIDESIIESIGETADFLYEQGKIDRKPELAWDRGFLEKALEMTGN
jgi:ABC-type nitrate/sulfonate/bicarbonate transport system substrate-binding protein